MEKLFLFKAVPFDKTDDSITEEYLIFNNKPSFENLKKAFESNCIYFSEKFTEVDYLKIEENVILFLPSILSHSIELKLMTKEEISKYLELDFTN